jgi:hypothetical protein
LRPRDAVPPKPVLGPGLCACGCGLETPVAHYSAPSKGIVRGRHTAFVKSHRAHTGPVAFWANVPSHLEPDSCWEWQGASVTGYGRFGQVRVHRAMYADTHGPIPDGLHVLHHCDNPPCCNPAHLFLGTNADNSADKIAKGREFRKATPQDVVEMRRLATSTNLTHTQIGELFGLKRVAVCNLINHGVSNYAAIN